MTYEEVKPKRKVIQIAYGSRDEYSVTTVLCDDGSMWRLTDIYERWDRLPEIPQDKNAI